MGILVCAAAVVLAVAGTAFASPESLHGSGPNQTLDITPGDGDALAGVQTVTVSGAGFASGGFGTTGAVRQCTNPPQGELLLCGTSAVPFASNSNGNFSVNFTANRTFAPDAGGPQVDCALTACMLLAESDSGFFAAGHHISFAVSPTEIATTATARTVLGSPIRDKATLAGVNPTGTITFRVYAANDATCSNAPVFTYVRTVNGNGAYGSGAFTPTTPGTYRWIASYSGDANDVAIAGACNESGEVSTVQDRPTISTTATGNATVGSPIRDRATLAGGTSPTGTITFRLYRHGDTTCSQQPIFVSNVTVNGNGNYSSANFTPTTAGSYRWIAVYHGNARNLPASGACNDAGERSTVTAP